MADPDPQAGQKKKPSFMSKLIEFLLVTLIAAGAGVGLTAMNPPPPPLRFRRQARPRKARAHQDAWRKNGDRPRLRPRRLKHDRHAAHRHQCRQPRRCLDKAGSFNGLRRQNPAASRSRRRRDRHRRTRLSAHRLRQPVARPGRP